MKKYTGKQIDEVIIKNLQKLIKAKLLNNEKAQIELFELDE